MNVLLEWTYLYCFSLPYLFYLASTRHILLFWGLGFRGNFRTNRHKYLWKRGKQGCSLSCLHTRNKLILLWGKLACWNPESSCLSAVTCSDCKELPCVVLRPTEHVLLIIPSTIYTVSCSSADGSVPSLPNHLGHSLPFLFSRLHMRAASLMSLGDTLPMILALRGSKLTTGSNSCFHIWPLES